MRVSVNFSKAASTVVLGAEGEATRCRLKMAADGSVMFMPTARKAVNNLPDNELKARKLTRDARKGTLTLALNVDGLEPGIYTVELGKHRWFSMARYDGVTAPLAVPTVRVSRKTG